MQVDFISYANWVVDNTGYCTAGACFVAAAVARYVLPKLGFHTICNLSWIVISRNVFFSGLVLVGATFFSEVLTRVCQSEPSPMDQVAAEVDLTSYLQATSIDDFIQANYHIIWQAPDSSPKHWNTFLLAECHIDEVMRKTNGAFISQFATSKSTLLLESWQSGQPVSDLVNCKRQFMIEDVQILPENIQGWDDVSEGSSHSLVYHTVSTLLAVFSNKLNCSRWDDFHLLEGFKAMCEYMPKPFTEEDFLFISCLEKELNQFINKEVLPLEDLAEKKSRITLKMKELIGLEQYEQERGWPVRTQSMIDTLQRTQLAIEDVNASVFLIAGTSHLRQDPISQELSLRPFYEYIVRHKNIVILKPKHQLSEAIRIAQIRAQVQQDLDSFS